MWSTQWTPSVDCDLDRPGRGRRDGEGSHEISPRRTEACMTHPTCNHHESRASSNRESIAIDFTNVEAAVHAPSIQERCRQCRVLGLVDQIGARATGCENQGAIGAQQRAETRGDAESKTGTIVLSE
jgi:hypothetical protein